MTKTTPEIGLLKIAQAARLAGLTPQALRAGLACRDVPVAVVRIGAIAYLRASEFNTWLSSAPAQASANLFK